MSRTGVNVKDKHKSIDLTKRVAFISNCLSTTSLKRNTNTSLFLFMYYFKVLPTQKKLPYLIISAMP